MNEDTSGEVIKEVVEPIVPPIPKKRNILPVLMFIVIGGLLIVSGVFLFRSVRNWIANSRTIAEQVYKEDTTAGGDASSSGEVFGPDTKTYLDSGNRFSFKYSSDLALNTSDNSAVTLSKGEGELVVLTPKTLTKASVKEEMNTKMSEIGYKDEAEITKIGSRAGYMFTFQNSTYMYFPLGIDSVLEIKVVSADKSQVDAIVQTIEFLPGAQTS